MILFRILFFYLALAGPCHALVRGGYTTGSSGFTNVAPVIGTGSCSSGTYTGSCIVFVDNTPGQGNNGTCAPQLPTVTTPTAGTQCATIAKAVTLLRTGSSDQLLGNRGTTYTNDIVCGPHLNGLTPSGSVGGTMQGSILFGTYGTGARPIMQANGTTIAACGVSAMFGNFGGGAGSTFGNNWAIIGWEIYAYTRDPNNGSFSNTDAQSTSIYGFHGQNTITNLLFEDNYFHYFVFNIDLEGGGTTGVTIRRNIITDAYCTTCDSSGVFLDGNTNILLDSNFSDHNGWNANTSSISPAANPTIFNHNFYIQVTNTNVTTTGNISTNASLSGFQARAGGSFTENLMSNDPVGINYGGSTSLFQNNVILAGSDITQGGTQHEGIGLTVNFNTGAATTINNNIFANTISASPQTTIELATATDTATFNGTTTITAVGGGIGNINAEYPIGGALTASLITGSATISSVSGITGGNTGTIVLSGTVTGSGTGVTITSHPSNVTLSSNVVYNWNSVLVDGGINTTNAASNCYDYTGANSGCSVEPFPAPTRSVASYDSSVLGGPGTLADFVAQEKARGVGSWPTNLVAQSVNNYVRAGFGR